MDGVGVAKTRIEDRMRGGGGKKRREDRGRGHHWPRAVGVPRAQTLNRQPAMVSR